MDLTNASAIITGGAGGLGSATVCRLAQKGAKALTVRATRSATSENSVKLTLAIWSRITSHRLGSLQRPLGLFAGRSHRATHKKFPCTGLTVVGKFIPRKGAREYKPY